MSNEQEWLLYVQKAREAEVTKIKTFIEQRIAEAYRCLQTGMWEHCPFDDCTREEIEGMKRAYGDVLLVLIGNKIPDL